jgi:hypothetical protein
MKRILIFAFCLFTAILSLRAQTPVWAVETGAMDSYLRLAGISPLTRAWTYADSRGVDAVAGDQLAGAPKDQPVILMGHSLGGVIARRMAQLAAGAGVRVKGYLTSSSPLSGDRLADPGWEVTAAVALLPYVIDLGAQNALYLLNMVNTIKGDDGAAADIPAPVGFPEGAKRLLESFTPGAYRSGGLKSAAGRDLVEASLYPFLNAMLGSGEQGRLGSGDLTAVIGNIWSQGTVHDLGPLSAFMSRTNSSAEMAKEAGMRRCFLVGSNGDIFESKAWAFIKPQLDLRNSQQSYYLGMAAKQWWIAAYWLALAADAGVKVLYLEGINDAWGFLLTGLWGNLAGHDSVVQNNDWFWGVTCKMVPPDIGTGCDRIINLPSVSHIDLDDGYTALCSRTGRSGTRTYAANAMVNAYRDGFSWLNQ